MYESVTKNYRGFLSVLGGFLIQLTAGTYHGTFGNLLPYFSSYVKQEYPEVTHGSMAMVFSVGGFAQGVSCMLGGLILVPLLGKRGCLLIGCLMFTCGVFLTYFTLDTNVSILSMSYGALIASAANLITLSTMLIPVTWFPDNKGLVLGIITSGYGLSSTVFTPLQTYIINPSNIAPVQEINSTSYYFEADAVKTFPRSFLYFGCIYSVLFVLGVLLTVEKQKTKKSTEVSPTKMKERLRRSFSYLFYQTFTRLDFYLLWLTRFLFLTIGSAVLAHWKTVVFTQTGNDKLVSLAGGVSGIMNCISRGLFGALLDKFRFCHLMPAISALLTIFLIAVFFVAQESVAGLLICIWVIYVLSFSHFSTVPAQTISLFRSEENSVVLGTIGLSDSFSYLALGIINQTVLSQEQSPNMFLWFFTVLACCSLLATIVTFFVSRKKDKKEEETLKKPCSDQQDKQI